MAKEYLDLTGLSYYTDNLTKYVDTSVKNSKNVLVFENKTSFPTTGEKDYIYFDSNEPQIYAWGGTDYIRLGGSQTPDTGLELGSIEGTAYEGSKGVALENRVKAVETVNNTQTSNISDLQSKVNTQTSNISDLQSKVNSQTTDLANDRAELEKLRGLYSKMSGVTYTFTSGSQTADIDGVSTTLQSGTEYPMLWSLTHKLSGDVAMVIARPGFNFMNNMSGMFRSCSSLISLNLDNLNTDHVYDMSNMFNDCSSMTNISLLAFKAGDVIKFDGMFKNCSSLTSLDLLHLSNNKATSMSGMFQGCSKLTEINGDSLNTKNATNLSNMFSGCSSLTNLNNWLFGTSNVTNMTSMFDGCSSLTTLDLSKFDFSNVMVMSNMFRGCTSLYSLTGSTQGIGASFIRPNDGLDMSECPLTASSAMVIIEGLSTVSVKRTLELKASTYAALTTDQIKQANNKNWTVVSV